MMERVICWSLAITLAVLLGVVVSQQLFGPDPNPVFGMIAERSGLAFVEPWGRYLVVVAEVAAIVLLLVPRTRSWGAYLALAVSIGAIAMHLSPWLGIAVPRGDLISGDTDKGAMFMLAAAIALLSAANAWFDRVLAKLMKPKPKRPAGAYA